MASNLLTDHGGPIRTSYSEQTGILMVECDGSVFDCMVKGADPEMVRAIVEKIIEPLAKDLVAKRKEDKDAFRGAMIAVHDALFDLQVRLRMALNLADSLTGIVAPREEQ